MEQLCAELHWHSFIISNRSTEKAAAVDYQREALRINLILYNQYPDKMRMPPLARHLIGFANRLFSSIQSLEVALACSKVSIGLREQLRERGVCDEPLDPLCKVVQSREAKAKILSELRKLPEAIKEAQSVIADFTQLVERENPDKYMDYLIHSYNTLCNRISDTERFFLKYQFNDGEWNEIKSLALSTAKKNFELYQILAQSNPVFYESNLAMAHNTLAHHYNTYNGAVYHALQSCKIRAALGKDQPELFKDKFALPLDTLIAALERYGNLQSAEKLTTYLAAIQGTQPDSIDKQNNLRRALRRLASINHSLKNTKRYGALLGLINDIWLAVIREFSSYSKLELEHKLQDMISDLIVDMDLAGSQTAKQSQETLITPAIALPAVPTISDEDLALIEETRKRVSLYPEKSDEKALALVALGDLLSKQNTTTAEARECYRKALTILITQEKPAPISAILDKLISLPEEELVVEYKEEEVIKMLDGLKVTPFSLPETNLSDDLLAIIRSQVDKLQEKIAKLINDRCQDKESTAKYIKSSYNDQDILRLIKMNRSLNKYLDADEEQKEEQKKEQKKEQCSSPKY